MIAQQLYKITNELQCSYEAGIHVMINTASNALNSSTVMHLLSEVNLLHLQLISYTKMLQKKS